MEIPVFNDFTKVEKPVFLGFTKRRIVVLFGGGGIIGLEILNSLYHLVPDLPLFLIAMALLFFIASLSFRKIHGLSYLSYLRLNARYKKKNNERHYQVGKEKKFEKIKPQQEFN